MRFFINDRYYLSVIKTFPKFESSPETMVYDSSDDVALAIQETTPYYSCQVMELVNANGMKPATITDSECSKKFSNIIGSLVHSSPLFTTLSFKVDTLDEVAAFHSQLVREWYSK